MFTGIVQGLAQIRAIEGSEDLKQLKVRFPEHALEGVTRGASIAINGVCLTVTEFSCTTNEAAFDVMFETLDKTNLGTLRVGDSVNFERAARIGDEIGGHLMSGHVSCTVVVSRIEKQGQRHSIYFNTPPQFAPYLLPKGFAGLNGCSLTLGETVAEEFSVHLIPETLAVTTFGQLRDGDRVNLEVDPQTQTIVDTVRTVLAQHQTGSD